MSKTTVFQGLRVLDTPGIGHYKPPTFRQAVSFQRSIGAPRATIHETQTLPLTASVSGLRVHDRGRFAVILCERMSALPQIQADGALVVLARSFRVC